MEEIMMNYNKFINLGDWIKVSSHHEEYANRIGHVMNRVEWNEDDDEQSIMVKVSLLPVTGIGESQVTEVEFGMIEWLTEIEDLLRLALRIKALL